MSGLHARWSVAIATLLIAVVAFGAAGSVDQTQAAWTDKTHVSMVATGGSWVPVSAVGCVAMNANGTVKNGGYCSVTSVTVRDEWGTPGNRNRNYDLVFRTNAGNGYIQFTVDLSQGGGSAGFSWATAGLAGDSTQVTPTDGWTCAQLPLLTGKTPTNWGWGNNSSVYLRIVENRSSTSVNCG